MADAETVATLEPGQFLCLSGPSEADAEGIQWQPVVVLPAALEPACDARADACPPPPANAGTLLAECRIGANRYTSGCPVGWVREDAIEAYGMGVGGSAAEPPGVESLEPGQVDDEALREQRYAAAAVDGRRCEGWVRVGNDSLVQSPLLRLARDDAEARTVELAVGERFYQGRASHCLVDGDAALVLVQSDTDPSAALNQTVLRVDRVRFADGSVVASVEIPQPAGVRTQWVPASDGFALRDDALLVRGLQRGDGDDAPDQPFTARLDPLSLAPQEN